MKEYRVCYIYNGEYTIEAGSNGWIPSKEIAQKILSNLQRKHLYQDRQLFCDEREISGSLQYGDCRILLRKRIKPLLYYPVELVARILLQKGTQKKEIMSFFVCLQIGKKGKVQVMSAMIKCTNIWLLMKTEDVLRSGMVILKGQCIVLYWQKNMLIKSD